jgi:uncharacterized protein
VEGQRAGWRRAHGYVFEVPADAEVQAEARPLPAMRRFVHEALAVDPATGVVYLTEDVRVDAARGQLGAGFYRFVPSVPERLSEGGRLQALGLRRADALRDLSRTACGRGAARRVGGRAGSRSHRRRDRRVGGPAPSRGRRRAVFKRPEGCWYGFARVFFTAASGDAGRGQVRQYRPRGEHRGELTLVFESPGAGIFNRATLPVQASIGPHRAKSAATTRLRRVCAVSIPRLA